MDSWRKWYEVGVGCLGYIGCVGLPHYVGIMITIIRIPIKTTRKLEFVLSQASGKSPTASWKHLKINGAMPKKTGFLWGTNAQKKTN